MKNIFLVFEKTTLSLHKEAENIFNLSEFSFKKYKHEIDAVKKYAFEYLSKEININELGKVIKVEVFDSDYGKYSKYYINSNIKDYETRPVLETFDKK